MSIAYIGLGSNMGNREEAIRAAIEYIGQHCEILATSTLYETEPVGFQEQPDFLNGVIKIRTGLTPEALLAFLLGIESRLGRRRGVKNGPRTIDLDILLFDQLVQEGPPTVPHPRMHLREFVLKPMREIAANELHPVLKKTMARI